MTVLWERRVGAALVSNQRGSLETSIRAGALIAQTRLARWSRRAGIAVLAAVTGVVVIATVATLSALIALLNAV
jgi:hypothetical protein